LPRTPFLQENNAPVSSARSTRNLIFICFIRVDYKNEEVGHHSNGLMRHSSQSGNSIKDDESTTGKRWGKSEVWIKAVCCVLQIAFQNRV
jgi:hypothetical protein